MTYVALPCVASAVMKQLTNPKIVEKLKSKGVRVIKPQSYDHCDTIETTISSFSELMNISDTKDKETSNLSLTTTLESSIQCTERDEYISHHEDLSSECLIFFPENKTDSNTQIEEAMSASSSLPSPSLITSDEEDDYFTKLYKVVENYTPSFWVTPSRHISLSKLKIFMQCRVI